MHVKKHAKHNPTRTHRYKTARRNTQRLAVVTKNTCPETPIISALPPPRKAHLYPTPSFQCQPVQPWNHTPFCRCPSRNRRWQSRCLRVAHIPPHNYPTPGSYSPDNHHRTASPPSASPPVHLRAAKRWRNRHPHYPRLRPLYRHTSGSQGRTPRSAWWRWFSRYCRTKAVRHNSLEYWRYS